MLVGLAYVVTAPLLAPIVLLFFLTSYVTWRYAVTYIYERSYESGTCGSGWRARGCHVTSCAGGTRLPHALAKARLVCSPGHSSSDRPSACHNAFAAGGLMFTVVFQQMVDSCIVAGAWLHRSAMSVSRVERCRELLTRAPRCAPTSALPHSALAEAFSGAVLLTNGAWSQVKPKRPAGPSHTATPSWA
jgi:hypothetical protein